MYKTNWKLKKIKKKINKIIWLSVLMRRCKTINMKKKVVNYLHWNITN